MSGKLIRGLSITVDDERVVLSECPTCSALVHDAEQHRVWHVRVAEAANRYVPAPRYGS